MDAVPALANVCRVDKCAQIAVVDDDEDVRVALVRLMRAGHYAAEGYASGNDLLDSLQADAPQCVVLDLHMPGRGGLELMRLLAASQPRMPIVVVTGHDTAENRRRACDLGAVAYLVKPVDGEALLAVVEDMLDKRRGSLIAGNGDEQLRRTGFDR